MTAAVAVRSWLYVPGDDAAKLAGATGRGADALIVDLEDAVAPSRRSSARAQVADWLAERGPARADGPALWVRVNNDATLDDDLDAIVAAGPDGILLPKADLDGVSRAAKVLDGTTVLLGALLETARGVLDAAAIAASPAVSRLAVGEADLCAELAIDPSPDEHELWPLRMQVVVASSAAGLEPPCGPVSTDFRDLDGFRRSTELLRRAGFASRSAIHPAQVGVINEVFTPTAEERQAAAALVEAHERAVAAGTGVTLDAEGRMVDEAVIRAARRTLARGGRL